MEKLIRFDWAIKSILRDKSNFDILEGFLGAFLDTEVKVVRLLESEGNQEYEKNKFNRVDLLVETGQKELVVIEVQVESEQDFFQRIAYGAAKLITDHMQKGKAYKTMRKVISISIAYFNLGEGADYLYYGSTNFEGIRKKDTLKLTDYQQRLFGVDAVKNIFPEYYLIRVEKFDNRVRDAMDEWVYLLKNSEVRPEFQARNIQTASTKLKVMNLKEKDRWAYEEYMNNLSYEESILWSSREEGRQVGLEQGLEQGLERGVEQGKKVEKLATAKKLFQKGYDIEEISDVTGLHIDELTSLE